VIARQICQQGGRVAILARDADELARAKGDLAARGGDVLSVQCDLLDRAQIQSAVQQTLERFGQIDILINNAASSMSDRSSTCSARISREICNCIFGRRSNWFRKLFQRCGATVADGS
jgi:NADP-dependent 3-hydroxy acid dehydrogenase YdfG